MIHQREAFRAGETFDPGILAPFGSTVPADVMAEYAAIVLLEPEPKELRSWTARLHRRVRRALAPPAWSILRVTPNMERKVAAALGPATEENPHGAGLSVYVPLERYRPATTWRSRQRPLIPGYIFAELKDDYDLDLARANHAVRDVMSRDGKPIRLPAIWVGSLILAEACGEFDQTWNAPAPRKRGSRKTRWEWEKGEVARVTDGPFAGFNATIEKADRADRMKVFVDLFGRVNPVTLDEEMLEKIA